VRYAVAGDTRTEAQPHARATCPGCGAEVLAKCGEVNAWHWAHIVAEGCDWEPGGETAWHLNWKGMAPPERQEVALNGHRADVISRSGLVVELQHSHLSGEKISSRERAYKRMVWLFDGREAREEGRIQLRRRPDQSAEDLYRNVTWLHAPAFTTQTTATMFVDIEPDGVLWVGRWYDNRPRRGYAWIVTSEWFATAVINGTGVPRRPAFGTVVTAALLDRHVRELRAEPLRLDWSSSKIAEPKPCRICGDPAIMRDPNGKPCHKACAEYEPTPSEEDEAA
jgi:competence protein CoiA